MAGLLKKSFRNKKEFRIFIHRSGQHFYAQLIDMGGAVRYAYSTLNLKNALKNEGGATNKNFSNADFIKKISVVFAKTISDIGVANNVYYDRGKKKYCGLVKVFAEGLRENGILI